MRMRVVAAVGLLSAYVGCVKRVPEPVGVPAGTPHVAWIIMHGDRDNPDAEFACQSTELAECIIPVSRPGAAVFSHVHVYYHGAGSETRYVGSYDVGYFERQGGSRSDVATNITVRGEEKISNQSVMGIVTSTPGTYVVRFALEASTVGSGRTQTVRAEVPVIVR